MASRKRKRSVDGEDQDESQPKTKNRRIDSDGLYAVGEVRVRSRVLAYCFVLCGRLALQWHRPEWSGAKFESGAWRRLLRARHRFMNDSLADGAL